MLLPQVTNFYFVLAAACSTAGTALACPSAIQQLKYHFAATHHCMTCATLCAANAQHCWNPTPLCLAAHTCQHTLRRKLRVAGGHRVVLV